MNAKILKELKSIAEKRQTKEDPSHDFNHISRVLNMAIKIGKSVGADLDIVIPAALFHDTVVYRKDSPKSLNETDESAEATSKILQETKGYPKDKIEAVKICIKECSFTKGIIPVSLESRVLQDADLLEATGAISIIRTFSSGGAMNRAFYNPKNPLKEKYEKDFPSGVGLFYRRLLIVEQRVHSKLAKQIAKKRTNFLRKFLTQLETELKESGIVN